MPEWAPPARSAQNNSLHKKGLQDLKLAACQVLTFRDYINPLFCVANLTVGFIRNISTPHWPVKSWSLFIKNRTICPYWARAPAPSGYISVRFVVCTPNNPLKEPSGPDGQRDAGIWRTGGSWKKHEVDNFKAAGCTRVAKNHCLIQLHTGTSKPRGDENN